MRRAELEDASSSYGERLDSFAIDDYGDGWADMASVEAVSLEIIRSTRLPGQEAGTVCVVAAAPWHAAHQIHVDVVVEQIKTQADLDEVRRLGFTHAEGWFWDGPPVR